MRNFKGPEGEFQSAVEKYVDVMREGGRVDSNVQGEAAAEVISIPFREL